MPPREYATAAGVKTLFASSPPEGMLTIALDVAKSVITERIGDAKSWNNNDFLRAHELLTAHFVELFLRGGLEAERLGDASATYRTSEIDLLATSYGRVLFERDTAGDISRSNARVIGSQPPHQFEAQSE